MSVVWKSEYEKLLDLVTALLSTQDPGVAWQFVGEHFLDAHFDAEVFTVNEVPTTSVGTSQVPHATPGWVAQRVPPPPDLQRLFAIHPLIEHLRTAPDRMAPRRSSDAVSRADWLNCETRSQLRATLGISHQLAIPLPEESGVMRTVVLMRPGRDFSDHDLAVAMQLQRLLIGLDLHLRNGNARSGCSAGTSDVMRLDGGLHLTGREVAVLRLLADGLTAESIGRRLGVSKRTVHKHLEHLYTKFDHSDRLSVVLQAQRLGVLPSNLPPAHSG
jgi:DNA-binding CsgD family transcriptional regulator